jgi:hypothetical protein
VPTTPTAEFLRATINWAGIAPAVFDKNPEFIVEFNVDSVSANARMRLAITVADETTSTNKKFGVEQRGNTLYILSSDGTTETANVSLGTITAGAHIIRVKLVSGIKIQAWLDGGAVIEKTTNLPSGMHSADIKWCAKIWLLGDSSMMVFPVRIREDK